MLESSEMSLHLKESRQKWRETGRENGGEFGIWGIYGAAKLRFYPLICNNNLKTSQDISRV